MTADVAASVLALLKDVQSTVVAAGGIFGVYDGFVSDSDDSSKTVSAPLPYAIFYPRSWRPIEHNLSGAATARVSEFRVGFSGMDRRQSAWAGDKVLAALADVRLSDVDGSPIVRWSESMDPTTDPVWKRASGGRLFYGFHDFSVCY